MLAGAGLFAVGALWWLTGGRLFAWFGHLPGDVRIERPGTRVYFPWVSMLVVSALLNLVVWVWRRWG